MATNYITPAYVKHVTVYGTSTTINDGNFATFSIPYSEEGYECYPIAAGEYRTIKGWYIHYKDMSPNQCIFDYINNTGSTIIGAKPWVMYLCITQTVY